MLGNGITLGEYTGVVTISADPESRYFGSQITWEQQRERRSIWY